MYLTYPTVVTEVYAKRFWKNPPEVPTPDLRSSCVICPPPTSAGQEWQGLPSSRPELTWGSRGCSHVRAGGCERGPGGCDWRPGFLTALLPAEQILRPGWYSGPSLSFRSLVFIWPNPRAWPSRVSTEAAGWIVQVREKLLPSTQQVK